MSLLEIKNVTKTTAYGVVLDDISFSIEEKGICVVLGKKSSGKSALAEVLAGCSEIDSGEVLYKGESLYANNKNNVAIKSKIGYVASETFFFPEMTVFEILDFTGKMRRVESEKRFRQIKEALEITELSQKYEVFVKDLSISEKKRLSLANALIGNPSFIILDDPTAYVSLNDAALIKDVVKMIGNKKTVVVFTDKIALTQDIASTVGIISKGKMVLWETYEIIKTLADGDDDYLLKTFVKLSEEE